MLLILIQMWIKSIYSTKYVLRCWNRHAPCLQVQWIWRSAVGFHLCHELQRTKNGLISLQAVREWSVQSKDLLFCAFFGGHRFIVPHRWQNRTGAAPRGAAAAGARLSVFDWSLNCVVVKGLSGSVVSALLTRGHSYIMSSSKGVGCHKDDEVREVAWIL